MNATAPKTTYLTDYEIPPYLAREIELKFDLDEQETVVHARSRLYRNPASRDAAAQLRLTGVDLRLREIAVDAQVLTAADYSLDEESLTLLRTPAEFTLDVTTIITPQENTSLEGLYKSGAMFCTQCEAEGFRKITYFLDRPDVLCSYTTTVVANKARYPVLLSNGNPITSGEQPGNRHWVTWQDPFPKPTYLFALVAGDLAVREDTFTTRSGREVKLRIFVEHHNADKCEHAMASLIKAMRWDEEAFGLEYDLDIYMIVAADDFNMGAMENKGLNIFNSKYVLARPDTATDADYEGIESVVAHEYFHNWTGNRVTCRDWFQLSLKEGLTVFRDQEFSSDVGSRAVKRIQDVRILRGAQFAEDSGPMAHPIRPASYMEISNFYTVTVYNKGAEVIRMIHTLIGAQAFRAGMDLYFQRHDGQAVTTEDFVQAMADASGCELHQFQRWYNQAGTPELKVKGEYDSAAKTYTLTINQSCAPTPGQAEKKPFHIPLSVALHGGDGRVLETHLAETPGAAEHILDIRETEHAFVFRAVNEAPVPSLLRGFSAPVKLTIDRADSELAHLLAHDRDSFNRWDAGQELAMKLMLRAISHPADTELPERTRKFVAAMGETLRNKDLDKALIAEALMLPGEGYIGLQLKDIDPDKVHEARQALRSAMATQLQSGFLDFYKANQSNRPYSNDSESIGRRSLKNVCLDYLLQVDDPDDPDGRGLAMAQFHQSDNMTDSITALRVLSNVDCEERETALAEFYARWQGDVLVLDKWFTIQAVSHLPSTLSTVESLLIHPVFDIRNPNKVRAVIGAFCHGNPVRFHAPDGSGYRFLSDKVSEIDRLNPQLAARLVGAFNRWRQFEAGRAKLMRAELERILAMERLSKDTYEVASKAAG